MRFYDELRKIAKNSDFRQNQLEFDRFFDAFLFTVS
jgi:hypothetical protein